MKASMTDLKAKIDCAINELEYTLRYQFGENKDTLRIGIENALDLLRLKRIKIKKRETQ